MKENSDMSWDMAFIVNRDPSVDNMAWPRSRLSASQSKIMTAARLEAIKKAKEVGGDSSDIAHMYANLTEAKKHAALIKQATELADTAISTQCEYSVEWTHPETIPIGDSSTFGKSMADESFKESLIQFELGTSRPYLAIDTYS